jgi:hypothetical protein
MTVHLVASEHFNERSSDETVELPSGVNLGRMVDVDNRVSTEFFIEPAGTPGPREKSRVRHLLAVSDDGRPVTAMPIPDIWSEQELSDLVNAAIQPTPNGDGGR